MCVSIKKININITDEEIVIKCFNSQQIQVILHFRNI